MSLPSFMEVRARIEKVQSVEMRMLLKALYLLGAARVSEMTGKKYSSEPVRPEIIYGPKGTDVRLETYQPAPDLNQVINVLHQIKNKKVTVEQAIDDFSRKISVAVFKRRIARQQLEEGEPRYHYVALPMPKGYEPWTKELFEYFKDAGDEYVFPFTRQEAFQYVTNNQVFKDLTYPIKERPIKKFIVGPKMLDMVSPPHPKELKLEGLRQVRIDELKNKYGFNKFDVEAYAGLNVSQNVPGQMDDFGIQDWTQYINKLCKLDD